MITLTLFSKPLRVLALMLLIIPVLTFNSCKKSEDDPTPQSGKVLRSQLAGKWSVEKVSLNYYVGNVLDSASSSTTEYDQDYLIIEFKEKELFFNSDNYAVSYDSENTFRYGQGGSDLTEVLVEFNNGKLYWKEFYASENLEIAVVLHKVN